MRQAPTSKDECNPWKAWSPNWQPSWQGPEILLRDSRIRIASHHLGPDGDSLLVEAPKPLPEPIMIELRAHKADAALVLSFQAVHFFSEPPACQSGTLPTLSSTFRQPIPVSDRRRCSSQ